MARVLKVLLSFPFNYFGDFNKLRVLSYLAQLLTRLTLYIDSLFSRARINSRTFRWKNQQFLTFSRIRLTRV